MRQRSAAEHTDRFIFLREKFSPVAFLFGPLWMLWRRLWLALLVYIVVVAALEYGLRRLEIGWPARASVYVLIHLLIGLEAAGLRRWTLVRRGWGDRGVVIADDIELAERRYFDARATRMRAATQGPAPAAATGAGPYRAASVADVIGLFPEPPGSPGAGR